MSTLVNLQTDLSQQKQSALDKLWAAATATGIAAQQALPSNSANATAEQNTAGGVSSLPAQNMLHKPTPKAVETVQDHEQQATVSEAGIASTNVEEEALSVPLPLACCVNPAR